MKTRIVFLLITVFTAVFVVTSYASEPHANRGGEYEADEHHEHEREDDDRFLGRWFKSDKRQALSYLQDAGFKQYQSECGDCHMAYPPGMLGQDSWRALMTSLDDHFDDNAELDNETAANITDYLMRHSAERRFKTYNVSRRNLSRNGQLPLRITDTNYFLAKHHELSPRMVTGNPEVKSISQCNACHIDAEHGSFNEDDINIPGYGRWDD